MSAKSPPAARWHADNAGCYSQFAPGIPEWNLRGSFSIGPDGKFTIRKIRPAPYQIPTDGSCGKLVAAAGWHAWRPAHLPVKASAPGHELLTAQLYFPGDPHNEDDIADAVKPELLLRERALLPPSNGSFRHRQIEPAALRLTAVRSDVARLCPVRPRPAAVSVSFRAAEE